MTEFEEMIQKHVDAITLGTHLVEAFCRLKNIRDQLASSLEYADRKIGRLIEQVELGDLASADQDPVRHVTAVVGRFVSEDTPLHCDPDAFTQE